MFIYIQLNKIFPILMKEVLDIDAIFIMAAPLNEHLSLHTISSILPLQTGTDIFLKYETEILLLLLKSLIIYPVDIKEYLEMCLYDSKYLIYF